MLRQYNAFVRKFWVVILLCYKFDGICNVDSDFVYKNLNLKKIFAEIEQLENIPCNMLEAISICESSKNFKQLVPPHPWTVAIDGKANYFNTKAEAILYVRKMQKSGMSNIDVGCMQINLHHHGSAFASLEHAFDPRENILYAAKFLKRLRLCSESWDIALSRYHSYNKEYSYKYKNKVVHVWKNLRANVYFVKKSFIKMANIDDAVFVNKKKLINDNLHKNVIYSSNIYTGKNKFL